MAEQTTPIPTIKNSPLHNQLLGYIKSWASAVKELHILMKRDFEFVNGRQASGRNQSAMSATGRELLLFNELRPQFELLSGHRASEQVDYVTSPRGREDKRTATISSTLLKATYDVVKKNETTRRVGDDGDIGGLGGVYLNHSFDYADDVVWGDQHLDRVSPFSLVWDIWGTYPQYQDGMFMGHRWWLSQDAYKAKYPKASVGTHSNDWFDTMTQMFGSEESFHPGEAYITEMFNSEKKHIAVYRLYYRVPKTLYYVADAETGDIYEGGKTREEAQANKQKMLDEKAKRMAGTNDITPAPGPEGGVIYILLDENGQPKADPETQQPLVFSSLESAEIFLDDKLNEIKNILSEGWKIWERKRTLIKWADFSGFEVLDKGELPVTTSYYPYAIYISRMLGDELEDIEGITRQIIDRQKEITKRYNHLADHLAHSAHSGFFNKDGEGATASQLRLMGSRPGIVVPYKTVMPTKIEPSIIPPGHFTLLETNIGGVQRSTGINSELLGLTSNSTVSGEAIDARQRGGITMLFGRLQNYQDFERFLAEQMLYLIQTTMPVEKMRRIMGVWEAKTSSQIMGQSPFLDPVTGDPVTEDEILDLLATVKNTKFDLTIKAMPIAASVRKQQFNTALQLAQLNAQTGRVMGETTFQELANLSELPERLAASLKADAIAAQQAAAAEAQAGGLENTVKSNQAKEGPNA